MNSKTRATIIRTGSGIALLALLLWWIGVDNLRNAITAFHPVYYVIALSLILLHFFLQSITIRTLLGSKDIDVRARHIFRLTLISNCFGVFLPGGMGPDMVLCYNMVRSTEKKEVALSSILFIRIAVLFLMALIGFAVSFHPLVARPEVHLLTGAVLAAFFVYAFVMANRHTLNRARTLLHFLNRHRITAIVYRTYFVLSDFGKDHGTILCVAPYLLGSAFIKIGTDYFIARALGFDIPFIYFFVFVPLITIVSALPLTFAGLGVREGSFVGFFALAGVPSEQALSVSLLSFTMIIVMAVLGALLYMLHGTSLITTPRNVPSDNTVTPQDDLPCVHNFLQD